MKAKEQADELVAKFTTKEDALKLLTFLKSLLLNTTITWMIIYSGRKLKIKLRKNVRDIK